MLTQMLDDLDIEDDNDHISWRQRQMNDAIIGHLFKSIINRILMRRAVPIRNQISCKELNRIVIRFGVLYIYICTNWKEKYQLIMHKQSRVASLWVAHNDIRYLGKDKASIYSGIDSTGLGLMSNWKSGFRNVRALLMDKTTSQPLELGVDGLSDVRTG